MQIQILYDILIIVWLHFVADFIMQSDRIAKNKSTSNVVLYQHVVLYCIPFSIVFGIKFAAVNAALHFIIDWGTSRASSFLWANKKVHWFFVVIGFDQALHMSCLFITYLYFFG